MHVQPTKASAPGREPSAPGLTVAAATQDSEQAAKGDLLMRFFESEWFDAWIAVTYLYKSTSPGVQDYLCNRLYTLPEADVERYLSQLCQLCVSRPGSPLERVMVDLCAQSLRLAVKTYWLLLAISQDLPKNQHVATLRDCCEQAALEGHWDLPFRDSRLMLSPARSRVGYTSGVSPVYSPEATMHWNPKAQQLLALDRSPMDVRRFNSFDGRPMSPDVPSRPMSPEGLGGGIFSTVFMDTGMEGLMYDDLPLDLRLRRQRVASPKGSHPNLHALAQHGSASRQRLDSDRLSSLKQQLGDVEGVGDLLLRVHSDEGRSLVLRPEDGSMFSPPSSPRRRETTFGATLDFLEALCAASSGLNAIQGEDRQLVLQKALQRINVEIDRAARKGVAIWFPSCCADHQRVVRLAYRESVLLNSREKAPFTLCVEVLDEEVAEQEAAAAAAAAAAQLRASKEAEADAEAAAARAASAHMRTGSGCADSAQSLLDSADYSNMPSPAAAAAAAAAAAGIPFVAHHQRSLSHETSSSSLAAAAMAAVHDSSAADRDGAGRAGPSRSDSSAAEQAASQLNVQTLQSEASCASAQQHLVSELSFASAQQNLQSETSFASTLFASVSFADFASEHTPSPAKSGSSPAKSEGDSPTLVRRLSGELSAVSVIGADEGSPVKQQRQQQQQPTSTIDLQPHAQAPGYCPTTGTSLSGSAAGGQPQLLPAAKVQGGGHWIGSSRPSLLAAAKGPGPRPEDGLTSQLKTALAGLRGEAPLVKVKLEVVSQGPAGNQADGLCRLSGASTASGASASSAGASAAGAGSVVPAGSPEVSSVAATAAAMQDAERRRSGSEASSSGGVGGVAVQHACERNSWACKLGLCKLCNSKLATLEDVEPRVRVQLIVQSGLDLTIRKSPAKHQRVPSHEAILKVAKQHKLPTPQLPTPPPLPPQISASWGGSAALSAGPAQATALPSGAAGSMVGSSDMLGTAAAAAVSTAAAAGEVGAEAVLAQAAAKAAHGEPWAQRRERVRASSPFGQRPGWDLKCVIVKTGDDCRQELLAMQLIRAFHEIFIEAQLPLWLRPYEVLVTSNRTALIEMVPNAPSIHAIKSKSPPGASLRSHFLAKFGPDGPAALHQALRNFTESLAAYSLVCYLLQIKDRHNGNLLLDDAGHIIHIDFGFMLSNSPGGVNFESAPFKLTRELLEVMGSDSEGKASELFDYFKVLMIQGFLAVRKHADRITLLVEMMAGSGMPCFKGRAAAVAGLRKRFHLSLPEPQVVEAVLGLIADSVDNWRSRQYDFYQRACNNIL